MFNQILPSSNATVQRLQRMAYTFPVALSVLCLIMLLATPNTLAASCSKKTAKAEIEKVKPSFISGGKFADFIADVICQDFTGDTITDMALVKGVRGSAGIVGWAIFNGAADGSWKLKLFRPADYKVTLQALGSDIQSTFPIYKKKDPNCCPTGGWKIRLWRWNGSKYVVVRSRVDPIDS